MHNQRKQPTFCDATTGLPGSEHAQKFPYLVHGSTSDWYKQILLVVNQSEADLVSDELSVWNF